MNDNFSVETRQLGSVCILRTSGYINNTGGDQIAHSFDKVFSDGNRTFLFDLEESKIVNSIGVSILIEVLEKTLESGGKIAFCNCAPIIAKTFNIMGITQYAEIYKNVDEGLAAMQNPA